MIVNISQQQTKRGRVGLLAVAFTTPCLFIIGTGGYAQPSYVEATGNTNFLSVEKPLEQFQIDLKKLSERVKTLQSQFGLGVDQLSLLLGVSRPTIYSWIKLNASRVQEKNLSNVEHLYETLQSRIDEKNKQYLGKLLRRKLDTDIEKMLANFPQSTLSLIEENQLFTSLNYKLEGVKRSERLNEQLSSRKALI